MLGRLLGVQDRVRVGRLRIQIHRWHVTGSRYNRYAVRTVGQVELLRVDRHRLDVADRRLDQVLGDRLRQVGGQIGSVRIRRGGRGCICGDRGWLCVVVH